MYENKENHNVPEVTFKTRVDNDWKEVTSSEIFNNKKVIVFSLPGAFTPTCSSTHLPRYNQLASAFKEHGVDTIVCLSVNDAFVMNAWLADQEADNIYLLPDGNGEFTEKMGMLTDKSDIGFGKRSWRYSMFVDNGTIKKMFIEPEKPGDPFEVSDADTMLAYLAPDASKPSSVALFTKPGCPYCAKAKELLNKHGHTYEEMMIGKDVTSVAMTAVSGRNTTPQVFIDGKHIGGSEDLETFLTA
ncbi:MAG: glutathione peroxidase [Pseudomonadota bacterium]